MQEKPYCADPGHHVGTCCVVAKENSCAEIPVSFLAQPF